MFQWQMLIVTSMYIKALGKDGCDSNDLGSCLGENRCYGGETFPQSLVSQTAPVLRGCREAQSNQDSRIIPKTSISLLDDLCSLSSIFFHLPSAFKWSTSVKNKFILLFHWKLHPWELPPLQNQTVTSIFMPVNQWQMFINIWVKYLTQFCDSFITLTPCL